MNTTKIMRSLLTVAVLLMGVLFVAGARPPEAVQPGELMRLAQSETVASELDGTYMGMVELQWAQPGEYSDSLSPPTADPEAPAPDLGVMDLGLQLSQTGSTVSGYVDLEFTLVFTTEHTVDGTAFGPAVEGSFDGTDLLLESERVSLVSAGRILMRQFRLTGALAPNVENVLEGEYRETVWGYGPQPLTIVGSFRLVGEQPFEPASVPPVAAFSASPVFGEAPLSVTFSDESTGDPTGWSWDFGDGKTSTESSPTHSYTEAGVYTVSLTVTSEDGSDTRTRIDYIHVVKPGELAAWFSAEPASGEAPLTVTFTDQSTGSPAGWAWDFGDGEGSTEQNPIHIYTVPGTYVAQLTISNAAGTQTRSKEISIFVNPSSSDLVAEFSASPVFGEAPLNVTFADESTGDPTSWEWDFGDGKTSTEISPTHSYEEAGVYTVKLTVAGTAGSDTRTRTDYIHVVNPGELAAWFSADPASGDAPLAVTFTDQSTGSPASWAWDFGDGKSSTEQNPIHTYTVPGTYVAKLTISNGDGSETRSKESYIFVYGSPGPVAEGFICLPMIFGGSQPSVTDYEHDVCLPYVSRNTGSVSGSSSRGAAGDARIYLPVIGK